VFQCYAILCLCNSPVVTNAKSVTGREKKKIMLLEGRRLVNEAVQTSQRLQSVFFTDAELLEGLPLKSLAESGVKFYKVKKDHMNLWSDTVTPQGILGNSLHLSFEQHSVAASCIHYFNVLSSYA